MTLECLLTLLGRAQPAQIGCLSSPDLVDREGVDIGERTANMPSTHRTYDKDFRQEAVNLLLSSGRPLKRVAAELGVTANSRQRAV